MSSWVRAGQYCARAGMSRSNFFRKVDSKKIEYRESKSRGREYLLETADPGDGAASLCTTGSSLKKNLHDALALAGVQGELLDMQMPVHLTSKQQAAVKEGAKLLAPMIAFREGRLPAVRFENGREIRSQTGVIAWLASQGHASESKLRRLWKRSEEGKNIEALARPRRKDCDRSRVSEKYPLLSGFVVKKWAETENISLVEDAVEREWGGPLLPYGKNLKPPRYGAIHRIIESIPKAVRDCATSTKQKWKANHAPYITTGRGLHTRPLEVLVGDHRLMDVLVVNDAFPYEKPGAAIRPWITVFQCMRTRLIVGWAWSTSPSWRSSSMALKMGISRWGMPSACYLDNGLDNKKFGAGAEHFSLLVRTAPKESDKHRRVPVSSKNRGVLARLGIKVGYCTPFNPPAKQVESFFSFVSKRFDPLFSKRGYTGRKPELRSDFCAEAEKQHKQFLAGKRQSTPLMGAKKFMELHEQWIKEFNEEHPHSGVGMEGRTPIAVMNELLPVEQRQIPDMLAIERLFWDVQKCKVSNCEIQLNNALYSSAPDDDAGAVNMYMANKTIVAVHCDPSDMAYALAYEDAPSGRLLARLVSKELAAGAPMTAEFVKASSRQRAKLRKASMQAMAALTAGVPTEIELLEARATGTDGAATQVVRYESPERCRRLPSSEPFTSDAVARTKRDFVDLIKREGRNGHHRTP